MNKFDILVVGSLNSDLVVTTDRFLKPGETRTGSGFQTYCGGKGANQAYAAAALGGSVAMIGRVGDDPFGEAQKKNLSAIGVDTTLVHTDPERSTGTALITVDAAGENQIIVVPGANGELTPQRIGPEENQAISAATIVLLQLETPIKTVAAVITRARHSSTKVILDPAPATPLPEEWSGSIDFITPNLSELGILTGTALDENAAVSEIVNNARTLCEKGCHCVIAKLGARGAIRVTKDTSECFPAKTVTAIDTTAAGDCFNAALAVYLASGGTIEKAIAFAVDAATLSVTKAGAQHSMPLARELDAFLQTGW